LTFTAQKVTALIVRETTAGRQLLLFRHPNAGIQIPAGTIEEGEAPEAAALREGQEESGLNALAVVRHLGTHEVALPEGQVLLGKTATVYSRPDPGSWDWASVQHGLRAEVLRREGSWVQIDFREPNRYPDPEYDTFRITGWVDEAVLCTAVRRHFYLLTPTAPVPDESWAVEIDYHVFRPFWAPLGQVLATGGNIVEPQRQWLDYLRDITDAAPLQPGSSRPLP
jgi:8-oxo-dGTP pyrophosphatase MutT (NUDIX family)